MKKYLLFFITVSLCSLTQAQIVDDSFKQDTIEKNVILDDITIKAPEAIQRGDKKVYFPNAQMKSMSNDALSLLEKMRISGMQINTLFKTVSLSGGGEAVFCINGRIVEMNDVLAIKPDDIAKIECNDNPGARYKDAAMVINFKLKNSLQGGGFMADMMEAFNTIYGRNYLSGKYNYKNSEWSVNYDLLHADFDEFYNMNKEDYTFQDGTTVSQTEIGYPGKLRYHNHNLTVNYNYAKNDKCMFNAALRGKYINIPKSQLNSILTSSEYPGQELNLANNSSDHSSTTLLDLYYQNSISKNKTFFIDAIGSYTSTRNKLDYQITNGDRVEKFIRNNVNGDKYAFIAESMYEVGLGMNKLLFGLKQTIGYANNHYYGTQDERNSLHNNETYGYAEWNRTCETWSVGVSLGVTYTSFSQGGEGYDKLFVNPMLRLSYTPSQKFFVRYRGKLESINPTLADLSNVRQSLDNYQIREGNPNLNPSNVLYNQLTFDYHNPTWSTSLNLGYDYNNNAIMESTYLKDGNIVRTFNNQRSWQKLNAEYELKLMLLRGMINFRGVVGIDRFISRGLDYSYTHNNLYGIINFVAAYKSIALSFNMVTHRPYLYGETLKLGEDLHDIALIYFKKNYSICFAMNNPFMDNYRVGSENWNKSGRNHSYQYVNETSKMMLLKFTWSLNYGKKHSSKEQKIKNEDTDTGVLQGKK